MKTIKLLLTLVLAMSLSGCSGCKKKEPEPLVPTIEPVLEVTPTETPEIEENNDLMDDFYERVSWAKDYTPVDILAIRNRESGTDLAYLVSSSSGYSVLSSFATKDDFSTDTVTSLDGTLIFTGNATQEILDAMPAMYEGTDFDVNAYLANFAGWVTTDDVYRRGDTVEGVPEAIYYKEGDLYLIPIAEITNDGSSRMVLCRGIYDGITNLYFVTLGEETVADPMDILGYIYPSLHETVGDDSQPNDAPMY